MTPEEASESSWPLVVVQTNETPPDRYESDQDYADVLHAHMRMASYSALKKLREAGRLRDVKRIEVFIYNTKDDATERN